MSYEQSLLPLPESALYGTINVTMKEGEVFYAYAG